MDGGQLAHAILMEAGSIGVCRLPHRAPAERHWRRRRIEGPETLDFSSRRDAVLLRLSRTMKWSRMWR